MPNYRRYYVPGHPYFITMVTTNRQPLLIDFITELKWSIKSIQTKHPFTLPAMVVLPDHLHLIMHIADNESNFSKRLALIKSRFNFLLKDKYFKRHTGFLRCERTVWQRRFYEHIIRNERDLQSHYDYIHYNPVKHGLVKRAYDWPYSSFRKFVANGCYEQNWAYLREPNHIADLYTGE